MRTASTEFLRCPRCPNGSLTTCGEPDASDEIRFGFTACELCHTEYPILNGVLILVSNPREYVATHRSAILESVLEVECPSSVMTYVRQCVAAAWEHDKNEQPDESGCWAYQRSHFPAHSVPETPITKFLELLPKIANDYWSVLIDELARLESAGYLLDVGCSVGSVFQRVQHLPVSYGGYVGCDMGFRGVYEARRRVFDSSKHTTKQHVDFLVADASELPFDGSRISCLLASNIIDVTASPTRTVRGFCESVPIGGHLLISTPWYWHSGLSVIDDALWNENSSECLSALIELVTSVPGFRATATHREVPWPLVVSERHLRLFLCDIAAFVRESA